MPSLPCLSLISMLFLLLQGVVGGPDDTLDLIKGVSSCLPNEFFSFVTKDCKDCGKYCGERTGEVTCQKQCEAHFLRSDFQKMISRVAILENTTKKNNEATQNDDRLATIAWIFRTFTVLLVISTIFLWAIVCRDRRRFLNQRCPLFHNQTAQLNTGSSIASGDQEAEEGKLVGRTAGNPTM